MKLHNRRYLSVLISSQVILSLKTISLAVNEKTNRISWALHFFHLRFLNHLNKTWKLHYRVYFSVLISLHDILKTISLAMNEETNGISWELPNVPILDNVPGKTPNSLTQFTSVFLLSLYRTFWRPLASRWMRRQMVSLGNILMFP